MLYGYDPQAVAIALPNLHYAIPNFGSNHALQAQLILEWDADFASQVLEAWKPSESTWAEVFGRATDVKRAVMLALPALGPIGVRSAIAAVGSVHGGEKLVMLMDALRSTLNSNRSSGLPTSGSGASGQSTQRRHDFLPVTPLANNKPPLPLLNGKTATVKIKTDTPTPSALTSLALITGSNPSSTITPRSISRQPITPDSAKENVQPSGSNVLRNSTSRSVSKHLARGRPANFQKLFAEDDARRPRTLALKTFPTPQASKQYPLRNTANLPDPSSVEVLREMTNKDPESEFRDIVSEMERLPPSNQTQAARRMSPIVSLTAPLYAISEEEDRQIESSLLSPRRTPKPAPSSPDDEHSEQGIDQAERTVPRQIARFPSVDELDTEKDENCEQAGYTDEHSEGGYGSALNGNDDNHSKRGAESEDEHYTPEDDGDLPLEEERHADSDDDQYAPEDDGDLPSDEEPRADSQDEQYAPEDDGDLPLDEEEYSDGEVDPTALNPWTWSRETNDEKVDLWGVEDLIERDPRGTAPVSTLR